MSRFSFPFTVGVSLFFCNPGFLSETWNVGHGTAQNPDSHFVALNLSKRIEIIEIDPDASKSVIILGPQLYGAGQELTPVTLTFEGGTPGHPDLVVHIADARVVFLNKQVNGVWKFVPAQNQ
jgi:hypothetical protein